MGLAKWFMFSGIVFWLLPLCLNATFGVHCSRIVNALMAFLDMRLWFALYVKDVLSGLVVSVVSIGFGGAYFVGKCTCTFLDFLSGELSCGESLRGEFV